MRALTLLGVLGATCLAGCAVDIGSFSGKTCDTITDCPVPYTCVPVRAGMGRTCELLAPPNPTVASEDAGVVYYCEPGGVKDILDAYCASCHSNPPTGNAPNNLRLDLYGTYGGLAGAGQMAPRVKARASETRDMPPLGAPSTPDELQRRRLRDWANSGARYCADGGVPDGG